MKGPGERMTFICQRSRHSKVKPHPGLNNPLNNLAGRLTFYQVNLEIMTQDEGNYTHILDDHHQCLVLW